MVQDVTAHSGREKYPNYHFLRVHKNDAVTRLHGYFWIFQLAVVLLLNSI